MTCDWSIFNESLQGFLMTEGLLDMMYDNDVQQTIVPDSKVHGAHMGPIRGREDPGVPHVGPMNFAIWGRLTRLMFHQFLIILF